MRPLAGVAVAVAFVATAPAASQPGQAGATVRGHVDIRRPLPSVERRPAPGDTGLPPPRGLTDRRPAVVYFETAPRGAFEDRDPPRARMDQRQETFVPHVLAVTVGTVVDFPNSDTTYHNVFSLSRARRFDLGRYAAGRSKSVRFDRPGIVRVFCDIHSHMSAFILVFGHRYFAVTDAEGRYQILGVPPGTYTLVAWYEGAVRDNRTVAVADRAAVIDADFVVR